MEMQKETPPWVRFEMRAVEDRNATIEQGHYVGRDVCFALITPAGSKDCIEREADEWIAQIKEKARAGTFDPKWAQHFEYAYGEFKKDNTIPEMGTPIKGWQLASPAIQQQILNANVRTVEVLADLNEEGIQRIGMGARDLQRKARAWLQEAKEKGSVAAQNSALEQKLSEALDRIVALEDENKALARQNEGKREKRSA